MDGGGNLYGTTSGGGANGDGTVFEVVGGSNTITTLVVVQRDRRRRSHGRRDHGRQRQSLRHNAYGGAYGDGAVFELSRVAPAAKLAFVQPPSNAQAGDTIGPPVTVDVEDANGNVIASDGSSVTVTLNTGTFSDGNTSETAAAVNGVATFSGLSVTQAGSYTLTASDSADVLRGFASNSFTISPAAASQVVFTKQAGNTTAGATLTPVNVTVEDQYGNVETGDNSSVSLAIGTGPTGRR